MTKCVQDRVPCADYDSHRLRQYLRLSVCRTECHVLTVMITCSTLAASASKLPGSCTGEDSAIGPSSSLSLNQFPPLALSNEESRMCLAQQMVAALPGPAQLFVAFHTASDEKLGGAWEQG